MSIFVPIIGDYCVVRVNQFFSAHFPKSNIHFQKTGVAVSNIAGEVDCDKIKESLRGIIRTAKIGDVKVLG